ncbi:hypothetical protein BC628DRAFT_419758 [Trametes gibbosa]|nr:hypothetical protein BC628DRAFT_419758 [Trametes gibbosa]
MRRRHLQRKIFRREGGGGAKPFAKGPHKAEGMEGCGSRRPGVLRTWSNGHASPSARTIQNGLPEQLRSPFDMARTLLPTPATTATAPSRARGTSHRVVLWQENVPRDPRSSILTVAALHEANRDTNNSPDGRTVTHGPVGCTISLGRTRALAALHGGSAPPINLGEKTKVVLACGITTAAATT